MQESLSVLGVDPGKTTGLFQAHINGTITRRQFDWDTVVTNMAPWLDTDKPDVVVAERFVITARTAKLSVQQTAIEVIGVIRYLCDQRGIPFVLQTKGNITKLATDEKLRAVRWYERGAGHSNDAARHVLAYLATTYPSKFLSLIKSDTI